MRNNMNESTTEVYWPNENSNKKKSYHPLQDQMETIKDVCPVHGGDCEPNK